MVLVCVGGKERRMEGWKDGGGWKTGWTGQQGVSDDMRRGSAKGRMARQTKLAEMKWGGLNKVYDWLDALEMDGWMDGKARCAAEQKSGLETNTSSDDPSEASEQLMWGNDVQWAAGWRPMRRKDELRLDNVLSATAGMQKTRLACRSNNLQRERRLGHDSKA